MSPTAQELATELLMSQKATPRRAVVVVEGSNDESVLRRLFVDRCVLVFVAGNSDLVVGMVQTIDADASLQATLPPYRGVIDRDYRIPLGRLPKSPSIVATELRDFECMMIASPALHAVLDEVANKEKLTRDGLDYLSIIEKVITVCKAIGYLRFWSQHTGTNTSFLSFDINSCIDIPPTALNETRLVAHLNGAQRGGGYLSAGCLANAEAAALKIGYFKEPLLACRGHDLMEVLAGLLRRRYGRTGGESIKGETLERCFRLLLSRLLEFDPPSQNTSLLADRIRTCALLGRLALTTEELSDTGGQRLGLLKRGEMSPVLHHRPLLDVGIP